MSPRLRVLSVLACAFGVLVLFLSDDLKITIYFVFVVSLGKRKFCLQSSTDEGDKRMYASEGVLSQDIPRMQGVFKGTFGMKLPLCVYEIQAQPLTRIYRKT